MQKHFSRLIRFGWLPTVALVAVLVSDMDTAVTNADKNIATILKNFGYENPPNQVATYIWENPWAAIMAVALVFAVGAGLSWAAEKAWHWLRQKQTHRHDADAKITKSAESPIVVHDQLYVDCVDTVDADGQKVEDVKAVFLCLWVNSSLDNGDVLRNVQARMYHVSGESYLLPIRDADGGTTNIRHGEAVKIEVGNVRVPSDPPPQAMFRLGTCIVNRDEAESNTRNGWRTLHVTDVTGKERIGIGTFNRTAETISYPNIIRVIISADNVVSRTAWLDAYLYAESPYNWLKIKSEFSDAEPK